MGSGLVRLSSQLQSGFLSFYPVMIKLSIVIDAVQCMAGIIKTSYSACLSSAYSFTVNVYVTGIAVVSRCNI